MSAATSRAPVPPDPVPHERTPAAHGPPLFAAVMRAAPEDFRVDERLPFSPDGTGEHLWLRLEKRLLDTADVVSLLERVYRVGSVDIGLSGLKDRRAVTRQWFSVRTARDAAPLIEALGAPLADGAELTLLESARHSRKLRRGTHVGNAFTIVLRDVVPAGDGGDVRAGAPLDAPPDASWRALASALDGRLARIATFGFPNYIGPQRFGRGGRNVERARAWFRRPQRRTSRLQRGLWLSAVRSVLFNRVCAARVERGLWHELLPGEPAVLDGSRSFFVPDAESGTRADAESSASRLARGDLHPSGPWWGRGEPLAGGACRDFEAAVLAGSEELREGLERAGLEQRRRALRALPRGLVADATGASEGEGGGVIALDVELPPGVFATSLLAELGSCQVRTPSSLR